MNTPTINYINTPDRYDCSINYAGATLNSVSFDIYGPGNVINIMPGCYLNNVKFVIGGGYHKITFESNVRIHEHASVWIEDPFSELRIGSGTRIESIKICLLESTKINIGSNCLFSTNVEVRTSDSHSIIDLTTKKRINHAKNVYIGNRVWVSANATILKGSKISDDSIVANNAVVAGEFNDSNIVIAGNPGKKVKENISWQFDRIPPN
jgi:acetyltransferase-like isoleucine patch superfamily enzyme